METAVIYNNILEAMGNTPLIRLNRMAEEDSAQILVKFEGLNAGGSIKTRTAYNMICEAERQGLINEDTIIVEPTSGNQGIGLALVGAVRGYQTKIIMPDSVSEERRKLVKHYGAEVILIHDAGNIGACIEECLNTALRMAAEDPRVFVPQQFENPANPAVHRNQTAAEILEQAGCPVDGFCSGIGTGGTITGIGEVLRENNPDIKILLSVGGWSAGGFSLASRTEEGRKKMAQTGLALVEEYGLDGIDIDWEYPGTSVAGIDSDPSDGENFILLLTALREALGGFESGKMVTIAAGGDSYFTLQVYITITCIVGLLSCKSTNCSYDWGSSSSPDCVSGWLIFISTTSDGLWYSIFIALTSSTVSHASICARYAGKSTVQSFAFS